MAWYQKDPPRPVLHLWPGTDSLLSTDPICVATFLLLQLHLPGDYSIQYCSNPDLSPNSHLPYVTRDGMNALPGWDPNVSLVYWRNKHTPKHKDKPVNASFEKVPVLKAKVVAHIAHIQSNLGDLVAYARFVLSDNWRGMTRPAFLKVLPVPQRFYMPERIRLSYQARLEAAQLWNPVGLEKEEADEQHRFSFRRPMRSNKKAEEKAKAKEKIERNRVLDKARATLDIYARLLGDAPYFYDAEKPSTLDITLAAHIYLLKHDQPDTLFRDLILSEYPTLAAHTDRLFEVAFPDAAAFPTVIPEEPSFSLSALLPRALPVPGSSEVKYPYQPVQERRFALMRRLFVFGATVFTGGYFYSQRDTLAQIIQSYRARLEVMEIE